MARSPNRLGVVLYLLCSTALLIGFGACVLADVAGDEPRGSLTHTIEKSQIDASSATRVEDLLVGRLPGVEVIRLDDGSPSVRVRGRSRLQGSVEPLYVIDGTITGPGSLFSLHPVDIESIRILKGAQAAIYGHRAGNAVLVVTTGSAGASPAISDPR